MEAGKKRLAGDIVRQANTGEVTELKGAKTPSALLSRP